MSEFLNNLGSASWWMGVIVVGILLNLVSAYIKSRLDSQLSKASSWWSTRSLAHREKREKELERLRSNSHEQVMTALAGLRDRMRFIFFTIFGGIIGILTVLTEVANPQSLPGFIKPSLLAAGAISVSLGYMYLLSGLYKEGLLNEARKEEATTDVDKPPHNNGMHPTRDTLLLMSHQRGRRAGDAGR